MDGRQKWADKLVRNRVREVREDMGYGWTMLDMNMKYRIAASVVWSLLLSQTKSIDMNIVVELFRDSLSRLNLDTLEYGE